MAGENSPSTSFQYVNLGIFCLELLHVEGKNGASRAAQLADTGRRCVPQYGRFSLSDRRRLGAVRRMRPRFSVALGVPRSVSVVKLLA